MNEVTSSAPPWIVVFRNVVLSAIAGGLFGCFLFSLLWVLPERAANAGTMELIKIFLTSPVLLIYILPLFVPLIGAACAIGVLFQKSIQRHLILWCLGAPVSVWLTVIAFLVHSPASSFDEQYTWLERILIEMPNSDHYIFLISSAFSSFVFYKLSAKGFKW